MVRRLAVALGVLLAAGLSAARAQEAAANQPAGFSVRKEKPQVQDAIAEFEKYRTAGAWEKAFAALDKALDADPAGLTPQGDGFFVPTSAQVRAELLAMPAAGREAYRLFYDTRAGRLYQEATQGADNIPNLSRIVDRYFLTSVGDRAADRLGDALWESGDFRGAERCWRMIVEDFPGSALPPALLQVKRGLAFYRAGQAADLAAVRALVHERFAGQTVRLGGRDVVATQALDGLPSDATDRSIAAATQPDASTVAGASGAAQAAAGPTTMPSDDKPAWQVPLMSAAEKKQVVDGLSRYGWQMFAEPLTSVVPPAAVDARRIYVNWFGSCFAADLETGKVLWRTQPVRNLGQNLPQMIMQGASFDPAGGSVAVAGDRVLVTGRPVGRPQPQPKVTMPMLCLNAESGTVAWNSEKVASLSNWNFVSQPLVGDDGIYICGHPGTVQDLSLLQIDPATGELRSAALLGTVAAGADFRGAAVAPAPVLLRHGSAIYVLTNNGALLAVDPSARRVEWAFTYPARVEGQQRVFFSNQAAAAPTPTGAMLAAGPTLYFKETGGEMLYALDLSGPSLRWKRPVEPTVTLAGGGAAGLYLVGDEADCIDPESHALQWSDRLSTAAANVRPLLAAGHLYVFGARGVHAVATADGSAGAIFRGGDRDGAGGALWRTADRLITVSSAAVTAYPLGAGGPAASQPGETHSTQPESSR